MAYVAVELRATCTACAAQIDVNQLAQQLPCSACGAEQLWPPELWSHLLERVGALCEQEPGAVLNDELTRPHPVRVQATRVAEVVCPACARALPQEAPGAKPCKCGAAIRVRDTSKATPWAPRYVARTVGEGVAPRFFLWIDEEGWRKDRLVETRFRATAIGCAASLFVVLVAFLVVWRTIAFEAAWQLALILVPVLFVLNTAARLAAPLFGRRRGRAPR